MPKRNIVWILIGAVIAVLLWKAPESYIRRDALYNKFGPLLDVRVQVYKHYVESIGDDELLRGAIDGMINRLDTYSTYFTAAEYDEFQKRAKGEFPGIGVQLANPPGVGLVVVSPMEGTPAFRAGLRPGDRIMHIDAAKTAGLTLDQCVKMISGPAGTRVTLTIQRPDLDEPYDVTLTRTVVNVPTVRGWARDTDWNWDYLIDTERRIGYVRVMSFEGKTAEQVHSIILDMLTNRKMRGLILDVRDNPGGLLEAVVTLCNRFLSEGRIVSTKSRNQPEVVYMATREDTYPDFPLAVLVNAGSASASEILAGALRDHHRAVLVGEKTFGKGSVQEVLPVENDNGWIKLTTAYYYLPGGTRIHGRGVTPDRIVDLTPDQRAEMLDSWLAVYSGGSVVPTTEPAGVPAPSTGPGPAASPATMPVTTRPAATMPHGLLPLMPATRPVSTTMQAGEASGERFEILIDPQIEEALEVIRQKLAGAATRPA
ncbi:MAG TPA: S41 family peptidase [Phycisphaerae bacterium]|nr:S41 family peptidase [Phycisphaerae bacterium]